MYELFKKYGSIFGFGLGTLLTVIYVLWAAGSDYGSYSVPEMVSGEASTSAIGYGIGISIVLCVLAVVFIFAFAIMNAIKNPKMAMKSLIGLGVLLVVFLVSYVAIGQDGQVVSDLVEQFKIAAGESSFINGMLGTGIALLVIATLGAIGFEVYNAVSKKSSF